MPGWGATRRAVFPGAKWQRCQFHLADNAINRVPSNIRKRIGAELRAVWNAADADRAQAALKDLVESYRDRQPALCSYASTSIPTILIVSY